MVFADKTGIVEANKKLVTFLVKRIVQEKAQSVHYLKASTTLQNVHIMDVQKHTCGNKSKNEYLPYLQILHYREWHSYTSSEILGNVGYSKYHKITHQHNIRDPRHSQDLMRRIAMSPLHRHCEWKPVK